MKVLVTGGAGFIGSAYVRHRLAGASRGRGPRARQAHLRRPAREPRGRRALRAGRRATSPTPTRSRGAIEGCDALVNFAAESHVDRSIEAPGEFIQTDVFGTFVLLEAARDAGIRHLQISTDEVYGSIEDGLVHRGLAARPLVAVLGVEGRRRPARRRLPAHLRRRRADRPRLEQLRPAPAPREADPALHPQRARGRPAARLRRRHAGPQLALGRRLRRARSTPCSSAARPARSTTSAARTSCANIDVVKRILELTGRDESLIELRHRPPRPRPPLLAGLRRSRGARLGGRRSASTRGSSATVDWYRENEAWWEPIRSGEYREYYERQYGRSSGAEPQRLETKIDGLVLLEPTSHGDERGFCVETFRADAWRERGVDGRVRPGQPLALGRGHPARAALPDGPARRSSSAARAGAIWDVAVDLRRDSPTYGAWEGHELDDENHRQLFVPAGFAHGFCVLSDVADVTYKLSSYYDPATEAGIAWDDPDVGVEWPLDPQTSERDRTAPPHAQGVDDLPFERAPEPAYQTTNAGIASNSTTTDPKAISQTTVSMPVPGTDAG